VRLKSETFVIFCSKALLSYSKRRYDKIKMRGGQYGRTIFVLDCSNFRDDPGSGNLITFSQFLFISIEGFLFTSKCGTVKPNIGIKDYFILVIMFFTANVCNNYAFDFNIPMPLHMIFRAVSSRFILIIDINRRLY